MSPHHVLLYALPLLLAASLTEAAVLSRHQPGRYDWKAYRVSMFDLAGRQLLNLLPLSVASAVFAVVWPHRLTTITLDSIWSFLLLFIGEEFFYYWYHRAAHRVRWFWATHAVHHSPGQLNLASAYRLGWTGKLTGTALFFAPLVWIGFPPQTVLLTLALNLLYQFWLHATWIPRLGWLEYVLNTPSAHRVHHASNLDYLDANFGGVLIVFDRLFGTYAAEREDQPCRYGLVKPVDGHRLFEVEFHVWRDIWRDLRGAHRLRDVAGYLLRPPGWRPDGPGETTEELRYRQKNAAAP
ncbi:sterol desaturase family protein [Dyella sp. A6]|uniref:sterol desaturase family protein n=1 Tax=Dyella aluminiiresistens TaxID=3069105 RepID=UPI002E7A705F|nr:sterol desaturase family protein [Dyella sp. A6]